MSNEAIVKALGDLQAGRVGNAMQILREALAEQPAPVQQEQIGNDWMPCMKLPLIVHVRQQRKGETHVSTRKGITPVKPDDLIMRGVLGGEYPISRAIFEQTYSLYAAPQQPVQQEPMALREALASALTCVYVCGRVWSAWGVGTMGEDDFSPASECDEVLDELVSAVTAAAPQPAQQEPVFSFQMQLKPGWGGQYPRAVAIGEPDIESLFGKVGDVVTFYTSPQPAQRKPLTLGQKQRLWSGVGDKPTLKDRVNAYGLAIEAAYGIFKDEK